MITIQIPNLTLTDILAVWGAALSTILAILKISQERRRLKITCMIASMSNVGGMIMREGTTLSAPNEVKKWIAAQVINKGRPISIQHAFLETKARRVIADLTETKIRPPLPCKLDRHEQVTILIDIDWAKAQIEAVRETNKNVFLANVLVRDGENNEYRAKLPKYLSELGLTK